MKTGKYVRQQQIAETTGTLVRVLDLCHSASAFPPGEIVDQRDIRGQVVKRRTLRWGMLCVEHDTLILHQMLSDATAEADDPTTWCDPCQATTGVAR